MIVRILPNGTVEIDMPEVRRQWEQINPIGNQQLGPMPRLQHIPEERVPWNETEVDLDAPLQPRRAVQGPEPPAGPPEYQARVRKARQEVAAWKAAQVAQAAAVPSGEDYPEDDVQLEPDDLGEVGDLPMGPTTPPAEDFPAAVPSKKRRAPRAPDRLPPLGARPVDGGVEIG